MFWHHPSLRRPSIVTLFCLAASLMLVACDSFDGLLTANGEGETNQSTQAQPTDTLDIITNSGMHRFRVEVVADDDSRQRGLMYRTQMASDAGMLFDFEDERLISMWMKNTYIPLDMLFIKGDGTIVRIAENTVPESLDSIRSGAPVLAVLELNAGSAKRWGLRVGDKVQHPLFSDMVPNVENGSNRPEFQ